jgi:hypothetical protein
MGWVDGELWVEEGKSSSAETFGGSRKEGTFTPRSGRLIQYREIRLALAPINDREAGCVLLSQDGLGWRDAEDHLAAPSIIIAGDGSWLDLRNDSCTGPKITPVWPHEAYMPDGWRRIRLHCGDSLAHASPDYVDQEDWEWDPVERPGEVMFLGRGYVSATRMTPDHLHRWLFTGREVSGEREFCPWDDGAYLTEDVRRPYLTAPMFTPARAIEACIHNGSFEAELRRQAISIIEQVSEIVADGRSAADAAEAELMARWRKP